MWPLNRRCRWRRLKTQIYVKTIVCCVRYHKYIIWIKIYGEMVISPSLSLSISHQPGLRGISRNFHAVKVSVEIIQLYASFPVASIARCLLQNEWWWRFMIDGISGISAYATTLIYTTILNERTSECERIGRRRCVCKLMNELARCGRRQGPCRQKWSSRSHSALR